MSSALLGTRLRAISVAVGLIAGFVLAIPVTEHVEAQVSASFTYERSHDHAFGGGWPEGAPVTLSVDGGEPIVTIPYPDDPQKWDAWGIGAEPGQTITATDGTTTKNLTVTSVEVTNIDEPNDVIDGLGPIDATVLVGPDGELPVPVLGDGTWSADLATVGIDLQPGDEGYAAIDDLDGDSTRWTWRVPDPWFSAVVLSGTVQFNEFSPDSTVTVTIDGELAGTFADDACTQGCDGLPVSVGSLIEVSDGTTTKTHTVTNLAIVSVDEASNTVTGSADAGDVINVWSHDGGSGLQATANASGVWTADFTGLTDFGPGSNGNSGETDIDGDETWAFWHVPNPTFSVQAPFDVWGQGADWPVGASVELIVDDDDVFETGDPASYLYYDSTVVESWGQSPWDQGFNFNLGDVPDGETPFEILPGQLVTILSDHDPETPGPEIDKDLWVADLTVVVDETNLTFSGTTDTPDTPGGPPVNVYAAPASRNVPVTAGAWSADFGTAPEPDAGAGDGVLEVFGGNAGNSVQVPDDDGDVTQVTFNSPYIHVSPFNGYVFGDGWVPGEPVTITADGTPVDPSPIPNDSGHLDFELATTPGQTVIATQNGWTAQAVVQGLEITAVNDPSDGAVSGVAPDGALVDVHAWTDDGFASRVTTAAGGTFSVDFSVEGGEQSWAPGPVTLGPGSQLRAHIYNDRDLPDHDATHHDYNLPAVPWFTVHLPSQVWGNGEEWPAGAPVELIVSTGDDLENTTIHSASTTVEHWGPNPWDQGFNVNLGDVPEGETPFEIQPGQLVTVLSDYDPETPGPEIHKDLWVADLTLTADESNLTLSGTTDTPDTPGGPAVNVSLASAWREVPVTGGAWTADFGVDPGQDGGDGVLTEFGGTAWATAQVQDDDGDATQRGAVSPSIHVSPFNNHMFGNDWAPFEPVAVTINGAPFASSPTTDESGHFGLDLATAPNDIVVVSQNGWLAQVIVADLEITAVNEPTDGIVTGRAPDGALVDVTAWTQDGYANRIFTASGGTFSVDLSIPGEGGDGSGPITLGPGSQIRAHIYNDLDLPDHDATHHDYNLPDEPEPRQIEVFPDFDQILAWWSDAGWWLTIERPGQAGFVFEGYQPGPEYGFDLWAHDPPFDVMRGDTVTMSDGETTNVHTVVDITVDSLTPGATEATGTGPSNITLYINLMEVPEHEGGGLGSLVVSVDQSGHWLADFGIPFGPGLAVEAVAVEPDPADGNDQTHVLQYIPAPTITASVDGSVWGEGWPAGEAISLMIDDPTNGVGVDFTIDPSPISEQHSPWPGGTQFGTGLNDEPNEVGWNLQPGHIVTATTADHDGDGLPDLQKVLTVVDLNIDSVDPETGLIEGQAPPDTHVNINANNEFEHVWRNVESAAESDENPGYWAADVSVLDPDDQGDGIVTVPFLPGTNVSAHVFDDDGDASQRSWCFECEGPGDGPRALNFFEAGDHLISQTDGTIWVYSRNSDELRPYSLPFGGNYDIQYLDDSTLLIAVHDEGHVSALDLHFGTISEVFRDDQVPHPIGLVVHPDEPSLYIADESTGVWKYDMETGQLIQLTDMGAHTIARAPDGLPGPDGWIYFTNEGAPLMRVHPDGQDTGGPGLGLQTVVDPVADPSLPDYQFLGFVFRDDGQIVMLSAEAPRAVLLIDPVSGAVTSLYEEQSGEDLGHLSDLALEADGSIVFVSNGNAGLFRLDPQGTLHVLSQDGTLGDAVDLLIAGELPAAFERGNLLISQTDGVIWAYDAAGNLREHRLPFGGIWDIQYAGPQRLLIANSAAAQIWELDLETGDMWVLVEGDPLEFPIGLAVDPRGDSIYIADSGEGGGGVYRFDRSTGELTQISEQSADGIAFGPDGYVYFAGLARVLPDGTGHEGVADLTGYQANGFVFTPAGTIIMSSMEPPAVLEIDPADGAITVLYEGAAMRSPEDVVLAPNGDIYVIDSGYVEPHGFGDDPGLYLLHRDTGVLEELHRGAPLGDTVDLALGRAELGASATHDFIEGYHFFGDEATYTFDDDVDPGNGVLYERTIGLDRGSFFRQIDFDIEVGQYVTVTDGFTAKTMVVSPFDVTGIDPSGWTIGGTASPDAVLDLFGFGSAGGYGNVIVTADGSGAWTFDLDEVFDPDGRPPEIPGDMVFGGGERDAEGDRTIVFTANFQLHNQEPTVEPIQVVSIADAEVVLTASYFDPHDSEGHTVVWDWGDGTEFAGTVDEGSQQVFGTHVYADAGQYEVVVTVYDAEGAAGQAGLDHAIGLLEITQASEDLFAPNLVALELAPANLDTRFGPDATTFTLRVTDNLSGFEVGEVTMHSESGAASRSSTFGAAVRTYGIAIDGIYEFELVFPRYADEGTWQVSSVSISDRVGHERTYDAQELVAAGFGGLTVDVVSAPNPDTEAPELVDLSLTPATIDVSAGDQPVGFTAQVSDDLAGFAYGRLELASPSGTQHRAVSFGGNGTTDETHEFDIAFLQYGEAGPWSVTSLWLTDAVGHVGTYTGADLIALGFPTTVDVASDPEDVTAPTLTEFEFGPPVVNVIEGDAGFEFSLRVTDDLSGLTSGRITLTSPTGHLIGAFGGGDRVEGDPLDGRYEAQIDVSQGSVAGFYTIDELCLYDRIGNRRCYDQTELEAGGLLITPPPEVTLRQPQIVVNDVDNAVAGAGWDSGWVVTLTVGSLEPLVVPVDELGEFHVAVDADIVTGDVVVASDGSFTKELVVPPLTITEVDHDADTVSGTATPGADVFIGASGTVGDADRHTVADPTTGYWEVDFTDDDPEATQFDLVPGVAGAVHEPDGDQDIAELPWWVGVTVSGSVLVDGAPLADVEVFLAPDNWTCTDADGEFSFTDQRPDLDLVAVTGRGVTPDCVNAAFVDADGRPLLAVEHTGIDLYAGDQNLEFHVERSPAMESVTVERFTSDPAECPDPLSFCWVRENMVMVQGFDLNDPDFQAAFGADPAPDQYPAIWDSGGVPVVEGLAAAVEFTGMYYLSANGTAVVRYPTVSDHLVLIRYFDAELLDHVVLGQVSDAADLVDHEDGVLVGPGIEFRLWDEANSAGEQVEAAQSLLEGLGSGDANIEQAIGAINDALDPELWIDHDTLVDGATAVFQDFSKAALELGKVDNPPAAVADAVAALVDTAHGLAQAAVEQALAQAPDSPFTTKALAEMQKAAVDEATGEYDNAIKHYRLAWGFATQALE